MIRYIKNVALILLAVWALFGGSSFVFVPKYEIRYEAVPPERTCEGDSCLYFFRLRVGNSGTALQSRVTAEFGSEILKYVFGEIKVRSLGVGMRKLHIATSGKRTTVDFGEIEPDRFTELRFTINLSSDQEPFTWDELGLKIAAEPGSVIKVGNPNLTRFARLLLLPLLFW